MFAAAFSGNGGTVFSGNNSISKETETSSGGGGAVAAAGYKIAGTAGATSAGYTSSVSSGRLFNGVATWQGATPDTTAPSVPTSLAASALSTSQIDLSWNASTDNVGVIGYKVYRNNVFVASPTGTSYSDTGLVAGTTYSYTVSAVDAAGNESAKSSVASATTPLAPSITMSAVPSSIREGDSVVISWDAQNATSCTASNGWSGAKALSGSQTVTPSQTATYTLSCTGAGGTASQSVTITVGSLTALPWISYPDASFSWTTGNTSSCTASGAWSGTKAASGSHTVDNPVNSSYILTCTGPGGTIKRSITITTDTSASASTKFTQGVRVQVTNALNVRSTPTTSGAVLGTQPSGAQGTVIGGPVEADGYWWWQIDYDNAPDGWSVENWLH